LYAGVPPAIEMEAAPSEYPKQLASVIELIATLSAVAGCVMLNIVEETQLFASVTARVYCPAGILIRS
jgi:hypothetical protein